WRRGAERRGPAQDAAVDDEAPASSEETDGAAEDDGSPGAHRVGEPAEDRSADACRTADDEGLQGKDPSVEGGSASTWMMAVIEVMQRMLVRPTRKAAGLATPTLG